MTQQSLAHGKRKCFSFKSQSKYGVFEPVSTMISTTCSFDLIFTEDYQALIGVTSRTCLQCICVLQSKFTHTESRFSL